MSQDDKNDERSRLITLFCEIANRRLHEAECFNLTENMRATIVEFAKRCAPSAARSTYVPLTREEIEKVRSVYKRHFSDGERLDTVCDMAINALLYAQEIDRLRSAPSASEPTCPGWHRTTQAEYCEICGGTLARSDRADVTK